MSKSWEQILGGYATDTLTEEEKDQLFEAALHDQALFDALADEEDLKTLLADPSARQRILASLKASRNDQWIAPSQVSKLRPEFSWFRQPSSLAWAGSIAAMGVALIFGWQMNNDWGSIVEQKQQEASSMATDEDGEKHEEAFRSEQRVKDRSLTDSQVSQKLAKNRPTQGEHDSAPISPSQSLMREKASKSSSPMTSSLPQIPSKDISQQEMKKDQQFKANELISRPQKSVIVSQAPEEEAKVTPSVAMVEPAEDDADRLAQVPNFSDIMQEDAARPSRSKNESVSAKKRKRLDSDEGKIEAVDALQLQGNKSSRKERMSVEEAVDIQNASEIEHVYTKGQSKGIRYHFFSRRVFDREDQEIDPKKFSGKWSELSLSIESNMSGHLYVLTNYGKRKWQWMRPETLPGPRGSDGAISMETTQPVTFALSQITNAVGNPVVSSIAVLLSSASLEDLGQWLRDPPPTADTTVELIGNVVYALQVSTASDLPLRVEIPLEK